jgi:hypothetical protein
MAGAGKKTFVAGDVLTASDVNAYLMDQAVMRFATASARTAALPSPSEGMMSYLDSTNAVEVYDGSGWTSVTGTEIPHAMSALNASLGGLNLPRSDSIGGPINVNWPSGKFSVAPVVTVTNSNIGGAAGNYGIIYIPETVSSTGAVIYIFNANETGSVTAAYANILAVQMTSGSATG